MSCARCQRLDDRIAELETLLGLSCPVPPALRLKPVCARLLGCLLRRERWTRDDLYVALYDDPASAPQIKTIDVHMVHLRAALKPHGITIETLWGVGYFMTREMKARTHALFETLRCEATA